MEKAVRKRAKITSKESYEKDFGFGFEEWNFSDRHIVDGWKYIYLEGIRFFNPSSAGKYSGLDIVLYIRRRISGIGYIEIIGEIKGTEWEFVNCESCNQIISANPAFEQRILQDIGESTLSYSANLERRLKAYENQYMEFQQAGLSLSQNRRFLTCVLKGSVPKVFP